MSIDSALSLPPLEKILEKISKISLQIQEGIELESILSWAIADARAILQTDRVLIYRLLENQNAVVAFETASSEWTLNLELISNPSFNTTCLDRYRQRQITTISDLHTETIDACSIQSLEQLEVKAILEVPIFNQDTLWGLLTVHHCRSPREWQPLEVQLLQQIALQLGIAIHQADLCQRQQLLEHQIEQHKIEYQHATELQQKQDLIQSIAQGISADTGKAFFQALVSHLIRLLGVEQAFVGEIIAPDNNRIKIMAGLSNEQVLDGLEYPLAGTPCEKVVEHGFCIYPDSIQQHFPEDLVLQTLGGEGYVGIPLVSSSGAIVGLIGAISNQAIANIQFIQEVLTIFAVRAASELERQQSEVTLRRYKGIVSATPDCVSLINRDYVYQIVNQTYLTWNQKSYSEIIGCSVSDLLGQEFFETASKPLLDRCLAGEPQQTLEAWQTYLDGQRRYIRATYAPYLELDGSISGVVISVHDLTDLRLAEKAFYESQERFRQMAASIREVFWLSDIDFTQIIYVSPVYEEIWQQSCTSLYAQPKSFLEPIHPDDRAQVLAVVEQQRLTGFNHEYRLLRSDGTIRWIWERAFPVTDATRHPYRLVGVSQDITDRKVAEIALMESQQQYQTLVENSPDIIERFDRQLRHLYVSPVLTQITGIPAEVFLGKTCRDLGMDETMINAWEAATSKLLATGEKQRFEFEILTLQGMRSFEMVVAPELSDRQTIESILSISRDVTDRKAAETALREQQQFTEQIAESTLAILYIYDLIEQRNTYSNQQVERVLGYSPSEIWEMGNTLFPSLIHPDDLPNVMANQQRLLMIQDDEFVEIEYRMRHKNGDYRWLLSRDRIFERTAEGLPKQSLGVATDITILKETQASLRQQANLQRLLNEIAQHIRQTLDLDHILHTTVTEVRRFLQVDRVVIYQFEPDWSGNIIAESVTEGWQPILGMHILDTYFVEQGHSYKQSRVRATEDIYTANLDPCHLAMLEQMQVRAKLVVPILQDNHLWGLLIAQHCRSPRQWEIFEIELQQQLATQIAIAIQQADLYRQSQLELTERQRAEAALQQLNQELEQRVQERTQSLHQQAKQERLLRLIIQNIHRSLDLEETLTALLSGTRQTLNTDRVAIYQFNPDWSGSFVAESVGEEWMPLVTPGTQKVWQDTHLQETQGGRYRNNETFTVDDIYTIGHQQCHIDLLEQFQARAYMIAPIFLDEQLWGLLAVYQNSSSRDWQGWEISLLQQLGIRTAIALRQSYLYQAVQAQVTELERLNQLKDDFLSTVSHELRSPMSSIKMAIQMLEISLKPLGILDDETNAINRYLKILREEGKREVSLINNLLDLSRLDAGTEPLNLTTVDLQSYIPDLVKPFVDRTHQHQQQLAIYIPNDLPPFTTDLPFLERILIELLHNACKYTPAGQTITISAQSVLAALEIRVSNSGVEIPAAECEHVFDKFYRIPNNDPWKHGGTGLGLALVKKLTERLGGSIYVESGCGQTTFVLTFGFFTQFPI